jgi:hypothetical protein
MDWIGGCAVTREGKSKGYSDKKKSRKGTLKVSFYLFRNVFLVIQLHAYEARPGFWGSEHKERSLQSVFNAFLFPLKGLSPDSCILLKL